MSLGRRIRTFEEGDLCGGSTQTKRPTENSVGIIHSLNVSAVVPNVY